MESIKALYKVTSLYINKKYTDINDISSSYTRVSELYDNSFLNQMHKYNEEMLDKLLIELSNELKGMSVEVLDLACGTGFNSKYLCNRIENSKFTLVDISKGMLSKAMENGNEEWSYVESDMLSYLKNCKDNKFDVVVCAWAIKYQNPHDIIKELSRVVKKNGKVAVIVNLKGTLPEIRSIYPRLIIKYYKSINKIMRELPNPLSKRTFSRWFWRKNFSTLALKSKLHQFNFYSSTELVKWVTSTGALAGFDIMVDMRDEKVQNTMIEVFKKKNIGRITHKFVWGVFRNEK